MAEGFSAPRLQWGMEGCEAFEVAIERRLHGEGSPDEIDELDRHVAGCAGCRGYQDLAKGTEGAMHRNADVMVEGYSWTKAQSEIDRMRRRARWKPWLANLTVVYLMVLQGWRMLPVWIVLYVASSLWHARRESRALDGELAGARSNEEIFGVYTRLLVTDVQKWRPAFWMVLVLAVCALFGRNAGLDWRVGVGLGIYFAVYAVAIRLTVRRWERELNELGYTQIR